MSTIIDVMNILEIENKKEVFEKVVNIWRHVKYLQEEENESKKITNWGLKKQVKPK